MLKNKTRRIINMARERRTKSKIIEDNIQKLDEKILGLQEKIKELTSTKNELQKQLDILLEEEARAKEEADIKELANLLKKKNMSIDDLKEILSNIE